MRNASTGGAPWRVIIIQVILLSGLAVFFKYYLPHHERAVAARQVQAREQKIQTLFQNAVEEDTTQKISVPLDGELVKRYPQKLRLALTLQDIEGSLGVPASESTDYQGGLHLSWFGTQHRLEAAFNGGKLYCLTLADRSTGHGEMVFASPYSWHPF